MQYNEEHGIVPRSIVRERAVSIEETYGFPELPSMGQNQPSTQSSFDLLQLEAKIKEYEKEMRLASKELRFEDAARARDLMRYHQNLELLKSDQD